MGNCIRSKASAQWGGEDWGSFRSDRKFISDDSEISERDDYYSGGDGCVGEKIKIGDVSCGASTGTEVKIKVSRKQLEQLLERADLQGLSAEQVLAGLMNDGGGGDWLEAHRRPWMPALHSIPE